MERRSLFREDVGNQPFPRVDLEDSKSLLPRSTSKPEGSFSRLSFLRCIALKHPVQVSTTPDFTLQFRIKCGVFWPIKMLFDNLRGLSSSSVPFGVLLNLDTIEASTIPLIRHCHDFES